MGNVSKVSAGQETAKTPVMRLFYVSAVFTLQRHKTHSQGDLLDPQWPGSCMCVTPAAAAAAFDLMKTLAQLLSAFADVIQSHQLESLKNLIVHKLEIVNIFIVKTNCMIISQTEPRIFFCVVLFFYGIIAALCYCFYKC